MKKGFLFIVILIFSVSLFAQKDVTKFLGIPVDGLKSEMVHKLKEKGFVSSTNDKSILEGEFNGTQVSVYVVTNNNKVYRIMLCDINLLNETDIKLRFNKLCQQFQNNSNYIGFYDDYMITDDEDISYEISINNKRYEAAFYQKPTTKDFLELDNRIKQFLLTKYSQQELSNPTEEVKWDIHNMYTLSLDSKMETISKKSVWFMISEYLGRYYITMFYDNEYNRADGEDL